MTGRGTLTDETTFPGSGPAAGRLSEWYDDLTRLPGPAFWQTVVAAESARSERFRRPATVVLVEALGLEDVLTGWQRGDALHAIVDIGRILRDGCRASDYVMRLGDTRFGLLLTETDEIAAINVVERLRARCEETLSSRSFAARPAIGWASPAESQTLIDVIDRAVARLRQEAEAAAT
jgi:diguanylate cyclase (GGDEF)-like protein